MSFGLEGLIFMHKATWISATVWLLFVPAYAQNRSSNGPEATVRSLIQRDKDARLASRLPSTPDQYMLTQFTKAFNASWANAMSRGKDGPVIDGDLITGRQTVTRITLKSAATAEDGDFAMVSTGVIYFDEEGLKKPHSEIVRFFLHKEDGVWKIDDINSGDQQSIRTYFKKSYGK